MSQKKRPLKTQFFDPRNGDPAVQVKRVNLDVGVTDLPRTNCFQICLTESAAGEFWSDTTRFPLEPQHLLFFVPYQYVRLVAATPATVHLIQFHANFLCIETFHAEVGCAGVVFNDPQGIPFLPVPRTERRKVTGLFQHIQKEFESQLHACEEVMLAYLKILLVQATRIKQRDVLQHAADTVAARHPTILEFRELIERHYQSLHSPADYADRLHITAKSLGRIVREQLGTTPTELIRSRILSHAKWQLLHTLRPVKEIAHEVGFADELYFSRLFKKATGLSPTDFREFETEIRGGSNLSMFLPQSPIPADVGSAQD